jgi:hypothetical protein
MKKRYGLKLLNYNLFIPLLFMLGSISLLSACSQNDAQRKYENRAFSEPENYTEANLSGEIQETDDDDWRIAPMYRGIIEVRTPAFPNPVNAGQQIEIELSILGIESVSSIEVMTQNENNNWQQLAYESDPETGLLVFRIDPVYFTYTNNYQNAIGLHRVFFFDSNDNLITYGDVKIE